MKDILQVKTENEENWLQIEGIHGVGLRLRENKIVVYVDQVTPEICMMIPHKIEDYLVDVVLCDMPVVHTLIRTPQGDFNTGYKRPTPAGTSIGHPNVTAGTLGSWFYNPYYNSIVALSNNHVLADVNRGKIKRSISTPFTVLSGGTYPSNPTLDTREFQGFYADVNGGKDYCTIDSVRPSSGKIGDIIVITGQSLGNGWWGKRVLFNGIEAQVRKWYGTGVETTVEGQFTYYNSMSTTIEVYVPNGLPTGNVTITIELDGDPSVSPGMYDYGVMPTHIVGQLLDYEVLSTTADNICDIGLMKPYYPSVINTNVVPKGANPTTVYNNKNNIFPDLTYRATGLRTDPVEGLAVIKTGRTTGTTCSYIVDCYNTGQTAYVGNDGGFLIINHKNRLTYSGLYDSSHTINSNIYFIAGGDSGSSVMTCPQDIFERFNSTYGISVPDTVVFDPKPYQFIGSIYAGSGDGVLNASDAYREWSQLPNLALDLIDNQNMILGGYIVSNSKADIAFRMYGDGQVNNVSDSELTSYTPLTDITQVNFELTFSNDNALSIQMIGQSNSAGTTNLTLLDTLYLTMSIVSSSVGTIMVGAALTVLNVTANASSKSLGSITVSSSTLTNDINFSLFDYTVPTNIHNINFDLQSVIQSQPTLIISMSANTISGGNIHFIVLTVGLKSYLKYEEIYVTLTQSTNINTEITRSVDLNLTL